MGLVKEITELPRSFVQDMRMSRVQALIFLTSWWCWTVGSMHFYLLPYTQPDIAKDLGIAQSKVAYANTTSMLSRAIGAVVFGICSDQFGRKVPLLITLALMGVFTLCTGFVQTYGQLLGVRFLYGITFGGLYGVNMAAALEAVPRQARGAVAGLTQSGFGCGNLLASGFHLAMHQYGWRPLFFLGAGLTVTAMALRAATPTYSVTADAVRSHEGVSNVDARAAVGGNLGFWTKFRYAMYTAWPIFIYCTVLTACFNTLGHGHLDVLPAFLQSQRRLDVMHETWVTVLLQSGGILGGLIGGYLTKYHIKWVPTLFAVTLGPLLPLLILPTSWNILALGSFLFEFSYGASTAMLGNILQMVCPHPGIRGAFSGVTYNLGNAISSIAPSIETKLGEDFALPDGTPNYERTILTLSGIMIVLLVITLSCMPLKSVNMEWDLEDPNQEIPDHDKAINNKESPRDLEVQAESGNSTAKNTKGTAPGNVELDEPR